MASSLSKLIPWSVLVPMLIGIGAGVAVAAQDASSDLPKDHWDHEAVHALVTSGILDGYPDGTFRGKNLVTRYALAVTLARAVQQLQAGGGPSGGKVSEGDLATLEKLIREFSDELGMLGVKTASLEERLRGQGEEIDKLKVRIDEVEKKKKDEDKTIFLEDGEIRIVGYNKEELNNFANTILNLGFKVEDKVAGRVGLQYTNSFDQNLSNDVFDTYEAYADFLKLKPFDKLRVGKFNEFLGTGLTLFDRREGFQLETEKNDIFFQIGYFDAQLYHVSTSLLGDARVGFYFMRQDKINDRAPTHTGLYARGDARKGLSYEFELVDYDNDGASAGDGVRASNVNDKTMAMMVGVKWTQPKSKQSFRFAYVDQEEDYRALAVDSDLQYHNERYTVLEDVLQAVRDATPSWVDPDEIAGFTDLKFGVDFQIPTTPWRGRFDWDMLKDNTSRLNNGDDEFDVLTLAVERELGKDTSFQLRLQSILFDDENPAASVDSMPSLAKEDRTNVRAQFFVKF